LPEVIVNTSPLQHLHQPGALDLLPRLVQQVAVPVPVAEELKELRFRVSAHTVTAVLKLAGESPGL
jgi:predicted nucleic acid-binding protein